MYLVRLLSGGFVQRISCIIIVIFLVVSLIKECKVYNKNGFITLKDIIFAEFN